MAKLSYQHSLDSSLVFLPDNNSKPDWNATSGQEAEILNKPDLSIFLQIANLGNILFVSSQAPIANNSQTRIQALGRIDKPFKNIQNAINIALNNDIIIIFSGTYNETLVNNESLSSIRNIKFVGIGNVTITGVSFSQNSYWDFENLKIINFNTFSGPGASPTFANCYRCNITTQTLLCSGQYLFENCKMGDNGSSAQGQFGSSIYKHKNCIFTNDLFYFYNNTYGMHISNKLIFENCEFKKVELRGDVLTPILIFFDRCKFISQTTYNLITSNIILTNLFLLNCTSNKPLHPSILNVNNFYNNLIIE